MTILFQNPEGETCQKILEFKSGIGHYWLRCDKQPRHAGEHTCSHMKIVWETRPGERG